MSDYWEYIQSQQVWERLGWLEAELMRDPARFALYAREFAEPIAREHLPG